MTPIRQLRDVLDAVIPSLASPEVASRLLTSASSAREASVGAGLDDPYLSALADGIAKERGISRADAYRLLGQYAMPSLEPMLRAELRRHDTALTLCLDLYDLIDGPIQSLVPDATLPAVDVEMIDAMNLRISVVATDEGLALLQGLLMGLAQQYGQQARFSPTPASQISPMSAMQGRRYQDVAFASDSRDVPRMLPQSKDERRGGGPAVAPRGNFR